MGKILAGKVNPSGHLPDIYAYDAMSVPAIYNAGHFEYLDSNHEEISGPAGVENKPYTFLNYQEGIYIGYRYYETRYVDNATGQVDEEAYRKAVQYPFGYGLSYTTFNKEITNMTVDGNDVNVSVKVSNTGDTAGKDAVQIFVTAPYTMGEIEKSHVVLTAFDKTPVIEPGQSVDMTLTFQVDEMASYDYKNEKCYVLDAGEYQIKLQENSHDVIAAETYTVPGKIVYNESNKRSSDITAATNKLDDIMGDFTVVSRADWEGTLPIARTENQPLPEEVLAALRDNHVDYDPNAPEVP